MGFAYDKLKSLCTSLGKHNDALYAVLAIAVFKGVMRPTFTMMDKESDKNSKKYAAFREGLTEVIAFASYFITHKLVLPLAVPLAKKTGASPKKIKNGLSFVSVCLSAGVIIPAVCNLTLKPIMDTVKKIGNKTSFQGKDSKLDIKETVVDTPKVSAGFNTKLPYTERGNILQIMQNKYTSNNGMRVG